MDALAYVNDLGKQLAARVSAFALTSPEVQTAAAFLVIARDEIGPQALGVASLAFQVQELKGLFERIEHPELAAQEHENPDQVSRELVESAIDEHAELGAGFLDTLARSSWARDEQPDRAELLQEEGQAREAERELHEVQWANLEEQLQRSREKFDELHREDSPEDRERAEERLNEAERAARSALEERQGGDREVAERALEALEKDEPEI